MNQEAINLTRVAIKYYEDEKLRLTAEILGSRIKIEQAEREIARIDNIKQSLEAALERLEEADAKEEAKKEMESTEKQDLPDPQEDPQELTDEEKDQATLEKADKLIKREEEKAKEEKGWKLCSQCNFHHVAPWNKKGICSPCQLKRKTKPNP